MDMETGKMVKFQNAHIENESHELALKRKLKPYLDQINNKLFWAHKEGKKIVRASEYSKSVNLKLSLVLAIFQNTPNLQATKNPNIFNICVPDKVDQ